MQYRYLATLSAAIFTTIGAQALAQTSGEHESLHPAAQEDNIIAQDAHEQGNGLGNDFIDADADRDGALSIEEAKIALPGLLIEDANKDGLVNQQEIEVILPELHFATRGHDGGDGLIHEAEFLLIVHTMKQGDVENAHPHP